MKKLLYLVPIMVFCLVLSSYAESFEDRGFALDGTSQEGSSVVYKIRQISSGFSFTAVLQGEPNQKQIRIAEDVVRTMASLKSLVPASVRMVFVGDKAEILVLLKSFVYKGKNLAAYAPSGVQFYYADLLEYDFRLMVQNLFLRLKGQFFNEEQFAEKIAEAADNPYAYIQSHDPEYIIRKFQDIEKGLEEIKASLTQMKGEAAQFKGDVKAGADAAAKKTDDLTKEFLLLRYGLLVLNNRGFFGSINLPSQEAIAKLVDLKKREPALTLQEAEARMQASGVQMTSKEVFLVFSVYFNEFK